jgi:hypothetical protein
VCTVILSIQPGAPALLAGVRDELTDRPWEPPGWHWPGHPGLIGGRDLLAGGSWLVVAPAAARAACVLNGRGRPAPASTRQSRGVLPLQAAGGRLEQAGLAGFDPFQLLAVETDRATLWGWDGERLFERELGPGLYLVVNSGLASDAPPLGGLHPGGPGLRWPAHERERAAYFLPRFSAAARPVPRPGPPVPAAWGEWLPLLNGGGLAPEDPRALIVRRDLGGGRAWGTTSISLVALWPGGTRFDFTAAPGDPGSWRPVPLSRVSQPGRVS